MPTLVPMLAVAALAACGTATEPPPAGAGSWSTTSVSGAPGADAPTLLETAGDDILVVTTSEDGAVRSSLSRDGAAFEAGAPAATGSTYLHLGGAARLDGGWFALGSGGLSEGGGDEELLFEPVGLHSTDGLSWEPVEPTGFAGPADIGAVVAAGGGLVAAGSYRDADDPSRGGFAAAVWRSDDGRSWTDVRLPGRSGESYVADLVVVGDRLVAVGAAAGTGAMWTSVDEGASWERSEDPALADTYAISGVAAQGEVVVASTTLRGEDAPALLRSGDGGATWTDVAEPPVSDSAEGFAPVWAGGGRFFTITSSYLESWAQPEVCYADIDRCLADSVVVLHASEDGDRWHAVDTRGLGSGEDAEVDRVTGTADGRVVAMQVRADGVRVHTWPAGEELPRAEETTGPDPVRLTQVPEGAEPEPGVRYHAPLYIHCGMDWLHLGGEAWRRSDDGPDVETGAGDPTDPDWPIAQQTIFGFATLVDGVVEYSLPDGEVIAVYERTAKQPPGCA